MNSVLVKNFIKRFRADGRSLSLSLVVSLSVAGSVPGLLTPEAAFADATPTKTVESIIASIKKAGNPSGVVDYVNWKKEFGKLSDTQKLQLKIDSAEGMKNFFRDMLISPSVTMKKQMEARLETVPEDKKAMAKAQLEKVEKMLVEKEAEMKDRIANTEYKVSDEKVEGEVATVKLTQTYKGETKTEEVKLEKDGSNWLLKGLTLGEAPAAGAAPGAAAAPVVAGGAPAAAAATPVATPDAGKKSESKK